MLGERIRHLRVARVPAMTLAQLAGDRLSISMVSKIERGLVRPSVPTLEYLADRLGTTASQLLGEPADRGGNVALARARAALAADDPDGALDALDDAESGLAAETLRAAALLALGRDDEARALADTALRHPATPLRSEQVARLHLVRGEALARAGLADLAQSAFTRALDAAPDDACDVRAAAFLALAAEAERTGARTTARNFLRQAQAQLTVAASPGRRGAGLRRRASADPSVAAASLAAAAELAALARAAALRSETIARLADLEAATTMSTQYREATDQVAHRSVRRDRSGA